MRASPEMFALMRHPKVLDILEALIGPEIAASPIYHFNLKLAPDHLGLADEVAESVGADLSEEGFYAFQVGRTGWHMDAISGLRDSHESQIVNAWIPITHATEENGCLVVIPKSHNHGVQYRPYPEDLDAQGVRAARRARGPRFFGQQSHAQFRAQYEPRGLSLGV